MAEEHEVGRWASTFASPETGDDALELPRANAA